MGQITTCIFCGSLTGREPVEHIVPEGLVGDQRFEVTQGSIVTPVPQRLILENDEICGRCNQRLGKLDSYLIDQCGFMRTLWNRAGTKSGRPATAVRHGMYAWRGHDGPQLFLNSWRRPVLTREGVKVQPAGTSELAVRVEKLEIHRHTGRVVFQQPMRLNKRFMRAIHKIAFELLCLQKGAAFLLGPNFDLLRAYILRGEGNRNVILTTSAPVGGWEAPFFGLEHRPGWPGWLATVRLGITLFVDLSPDNDLVAMVKMAQLRQNGMMLWPDTEGGTALVD